MLKKNAAPSERVRVKRVHDRGHYDRETVAQILDAMPLAHVGYVFGGQPYVTPTLQWREGDRVYWHGSSASRMLEASEGADSASPSRSSTDWCSPAPPSTTRRTTARS